MPATLKSSRNTFHPTCWVETGTQELLGFDGINAPVRWDGLTAATESVGIETPATAATLAQGAAGTIGAGTYYGYVRYFDDEGMYSSVSPVGSVTIIASKKIEWTAIPLPTDSRVTGRQLLRTTSSQATIAYAVTTLSDVSTTVYSDDTVDATLDNNDYIVIANEDGTLPADAASRDQPPNHMSVVVQHQNRMYGSVPVAYNEGHIEVTASSTSVVGVNTNFTSQMVGRKLLVLGNTTEYSITAASATALTISPAYTGTTNYFARYAVQSERAERLLVYYSYIGADGPEPEAWSALRSFDVPSFGGDITALISLGQRMYITKLGYTYGFSQSEDPVIDGNIVPIPSGRGCENQFTWCRANDTLFLLDRQGVYSFSGGRPESVSDPIQNMFNSEVNWNASKWFRMVYDKETETVRLFVALGNSYLPTRELCYYIRTGAWWSCDYPLGVGAADVMQIGNRSRVLLGCEHARVELTREGHLDGIALNTPGKTRGTATSATAMTLTDTTALFPTNLADLSLTIIDGTGKFQTRRISSVSGTTITLKQPFTILPDSTSVYQIGGFQWRWVGPILRYTQRASETTRRYEVVYNPTATENWMYVSQRRNHYSDWEPWGIGADSGEVFDDLGVRVIANDPELRLRLDRWQFATTEEPDTEDTGFKFFAFDGNCAVNGSSDRWLQPKMRGFAAESPLGIFSFGIDGVRQ